MEVVPYVDQIEEIARLYGRPVNYQIRRDQAQTQELRRWLAVADGRAVAVVTTWLRPDDRLFLMPAWSDVTALGHLAGAVGDELRRSVSINADYDDARLMAALSDTGFAVETVSEGFQVPFAPVLEVLRRAKQPSGYPILSAADADETRLFELDNDLRNLIAGTEGWVGDRQWFHEELTEAPPFDPCAYLVAVDDNSGAYVGLIRVWRNPSGPRLGMVGVIPEHRSSTVAAMLLGEALGAAASWGSDTFVTETAIDNHVLYPRLRKYGGVSLGRFAQLTRS